MESNTITVNLSSIFPEVLQQVPGDVKLFPHQVDCVKWLVERERLADVSEEDPANPLRSSLLGDVMGLGKTMSTVSLLSVNVVERTLVICPKSLVYQWIRELFSQNHNVYLIEPNYARRCIVDNGRVHIFKEKLDHVELVAPFVCVTSYGKVKPFPEPKHEDEVCISVFDCVSESNRDAQPPKLTPFNSIVWNRIVVDEVHNLRNGMSLNEDKSAQLRKKSLRFYRLLRLRKTVKCVRLGLTGTPLQNRIGDLASVFLFLGCYVSRMTDKRDLEQLISKNMFRRSVDNLSDLTKAIIKLTLSTRPESACSLQNLTMKREFK